MNNILQIFNYTFILKALIVGVLISICSALLGVSLVLKKYSMIGDGLSHVAFGALAVATVLNMAPLAVAMPIVIIVAFLLLRLNTNSVMKGDSSIAIISASSLAIGVLIISLTTGMNTDLYNYLFGSILAISNTDLYLSIILSIIVIVLYILFYNKIFAITFDEEFSNATGIKVNYYNMLLAALTAITIVLGMRIMGSLLISSLIIFPTLTSMSVFKTFKKVVLFSVIISIICFIIGLILSCLYSTPVGATIVLINLITLIVFKILHLKIK